MGGAVSTSILDLSTRRRSSRGSRRSRTSFLCSAILADSTDEYLLPSWQQRHLCDRASPKADVRNDASSKTAITTTIAEGTAQEPSLHIVRDHRLSSNTVNSIHANPWDTETQKNLFNKPAVACRVDAPQRSSLEINICNVNPESEKVGAEEEVLKTEIEQSLNGSPQLPVPRTRPWTDVDSFGEATANAVSITPTPSGFNLCGLRHTKRFSSVNCSSQSKAVIATSNFKATHQRLFEEPRSRSNSTSVNKIVNGDNPFGWGSHEERRTSSTLLSTEECNVRISTDASLQCSNNKLKVGALPQYSAADTIPVVDQQQQSLLPPSASITTEDVSYTPLRMRLSVTNSFFSDPPSTEMDLQRAITAVDAYASHMRQLLTSWQDILHHHFDAFAVEVGSVLASQPLPYGRGVSADTLPEDHARMMLLMIDRAVPLVSHMEDMLEVLLEVGAMHRRNNVGASYFEALHQAFMQVLPHYVPADQRENLCDAVWEPFWQLVVRLLTQGNRTERGDWYAAQRRAEWLADARAVLEAVSKQQQNASYRGTFVPAMLDRAEAVNPAMTQFFLMREPRIAVRFLEGLMLVALQLDDDAKRVHYIEQLARRHIVYGLSEWGLRELRQPFIDASKYYAQLSAHPDVWTPTAAESLGLFWDMLTQYWTAGIAVSRRSLANIEGLRAPNGSRPFCMMLTDIEAGSRLWGLYPFTMADAVDAHHRIIRKLIADHGAYEVKTDGDSFVIAAKDVLTALQIAVSTQLELMRGPIVEGFRMVSEVQGGGISSCWRSDSLRVRIGIHYCTDASVVYDSVHERFDYYGPSVSSAALTAAAAAGGQILITQDAMNALGVSQSEHEESPRPIAKIQPGSNPMDAVLDDILEFQWWGEQRFRGISSPVSLYSVLPIRLSGRTFPYYVGSRKVRVSAPSDIDGRKEVHRLSLAQLKVGNLDGSTSALFR